MKIEAPVRIWATVNGASTRLPDGGRQLIGGWSQDAGRANAIEYVRADRADAEFDEMARSCLAEREGRIEAEAAATFARPSEQAATEALKEVRALLVVERMDDGRIGGIRHDSDALPKIVAILDAALKAVSETGR